MSCRNSGIVFFLGNRAHYQVLQNPDTNGNSSIYRGDSSDEYRCNCAKCEHRDSTDKYSEIGANTKDKQTNSGPECDQDEMKPAILNRNEDYPQPEKPKKPSRRARIVSFFKSLARRRRKDDRQQHIKDLESALRGCTYRNSCRCFECQSNYFEYIEEDSDSDDSLAEAYEQITGAEWTKYTNYAQQNAYLVQDMLHYHELDEVPANASLEYKDRDDDDYEEIFIDTAPNPHESTEVMKLKKMTISSLDEANTGRQVTWSESHHELLNENDPSDGYLINTDITLKLNVLSEILHKPSYSQFACNIQ